mmetsp:Transcript_38760/g.101298  ORF Transcript_38760/g.101298 Transcript_38760/m.101298 type:complete len:460 (-) Transcript_38760:128-1507(-)
MRTMRQVNPKTGEMFAEYEPMGDEQVRSIVGESHAAFQHWRRETPAARAQKLAPLAEALRARAEVAAELMSAEMGKPIPQAVAEVKKCAFLVDWYAEHGAAFLQNTPAPTLPGFKQCYVTYQPLGVILSVMPWNFPFWQAIRMAVPTILAGNTVVLKHASNCQGSAKMIEEIFQSCPSIPADLFRSLIIPSGQVAPVLEHPLVRGVALTGSTYAGQQVAAKAGGLLKKAVVELGGSDAYVVLADADLDVAAEAVVNGRILNTGQSCISPKRVIAVKEVRKELEAKVQALLETKKYGVDFGCMVNPSGREETVQQIEASLAAGAKLVTGGPGVPPPEGDCGTSFLQPTMLSEVQPGMPAFDEEVFGPVIAVIEAQGEEDALRMANQSEFGLGSAVFTRDLEKAAMLAETEMDAGMCFVNDFVRSDPSLPFGGTKTSGLGRECAQFGLMEFVNIKTVAIKG